MLFVHNQVGDKVTKFKVGDNCAVGCFIDACLDCTNCYKGDEQYCIKGMTGTYNGDKKHGRVGGKFYNGFYIRICNENACQLISMSFIL